ncbi:hypothetical protein HFN62_18280 [Rhizobium leguminosarum]|nr:hypothetical protein [Rhizobium leguminosarum]MBY5785664.1 hypothetical protein [Rhizobium leguminosarum]
MILKVILAFGIVVYVVLDCFDLRIGIEELIRAWETLPPTMRETDGPGF